MARIPLVDSTDPSADPRAVASLEAARENHGVELNVHRALANHPELMDRLWALTDVAYLDNSLNPVQRELAYYTAAVTNSCHY